MSLREADFSVGFKLERLGLDQAFDLELKHLEVGIFSHFLYVYGYICSINPALILFPLILLKTHFLGF